jgi:hypothetical protein
MVARSSILRAFVAARGCDCVLAIGLVMACVQHACAEEPPRYGADVRPILAEHCFACHGPGKQVSGLRLDVRDSALQGGDFGEPALVPGAPDSSPMLAYVSDSEHATAMPPPGDGRRRLNAEEIETLRTWIASGAAWDASMEGEHEVSQPWSFQPLRKEFEHASIDGFLEAQRQLAGLTTSPEAEPHAIHRRLAYGLTGLPPTPSQVQSFVQEYAQDPDGAVSALVDELLATPQYGERWARHWLDVVRFAESDGFEMNHPRPNAWHYRDYVIDAFNSDLPYDDFIRHQLAGDRWGVDRATGFLVGGPWDRVKSPDPVLTANQRADELHDMVSTTASTFLGLTVGCARCHSHKFDPIPQVDYYRMKACLSGVQHGEREIRPPAPAEVEAAQSRRPRVTHAENSDRFRPTLARYLRFEILATSGSEPCIDELEIFSIGGDNIARNAAVTSTGDYADHPFHKLAHIQDGQYGNERSWISNQPGRGQVEFDFGKNYEIDRVLWSRDRSEPAKYTDRVATQYTISVSVDGMQWECVSDSSDRETTSLEYPRIYAGVLGTPETVYRLQRGDPTQPREAIVPGGLSALSGFALPMEASDQERRVALAEWIAAPSNPLTARVIVNRLWHYHFGCGIVDTPSDFGAGGGAPSHPELLDWLAVQLIENRWSIKSIQRLICNSQAYRQSSGMHAAGLASDAGNRLLWHFSPRRLEAEPLRDAILALSGDLDFRVGGPGFDLFEPNENYVRVFETKAKYLGPEYRRMVYQRKPRVELDQLFGPFDCPDAGQIQPRRNVSTTPLQALNLLNSQFILDQSDHFAARLRREGGDGASQQIDLAFRLAFSRAPTLAEASLSQRFVEEHGLVAFCRALYNANEFIMVY